MQWRVVNEFYDDFRKALIALERLQLGRFGGICRTTPMGGPHLVREAHDWEVEATRVVV